VLRDAFTPGRLEGAGTPFNLPQAIGYGRQPYACYPAGKGGCVAGPSGVVMGIFGWLDPVALQVSNLYSAGFPLGFVLPVFNLWNFQRVFAQFSPLTGSELVLRQGMECVLAVQGDFLARFPLGAQAGNQVWTDPATGLPYDADGGGYVATPWTLMQGSCECGARLRISSFVKPLN
jgi:hypothetical protein